MSQEDLAADPRGGLAVAPTQLPTDAYTLYEEKRKREQAASPSTYLGAMWRQDSPVDGLVADAVGRQFAPDPSYAPFEPKEWARLTQGIPEEYHRYFYGATSQPHAEFIRDRLYSKMDDLQQLGDLGFAGNAGRLMFGLVEPTNVLAGIASGGIAGSVSSVARAARQFQRAKTSIEVERATAAMATAAQAQVSPTAVAAGLGSAALANAGFEKLRQGVNFEDDSGQIVEASIMGTLFAAPFVAVNARQMSRLARAADMDYRSMKVVRKVQTGEKLDAEDHATIKEFNAAVSHIEGVETGNKAPETIFVDSKGVATKQSDRVLFGDSEGRVSDRLPEDGGNLGFFREQLRNDLQAQTREVLGARRSDVISQEKGAEPTRPLTTEGQPVERRVDTAARKRIDEMSAEELRSVLKTSEIAGIPNKRAYDESTKQQFQVAMDLDGLKHINDTYGHEAGNQAIRAAGKALQDEGVDAYHFHGDEFAAQGDTPDIEAKIQRAVERLKQAELTANDLEGRPITLTGTRFSYGVGKSQAVADAALNAAKKARPARERGAAPEGFGPKAPEGFGHGTVGAAQTGAGVQHVDVSPEFDNPTSRSKWRFDIFARLNRSSNPHVQELAHLLVKDAIGNSKSWAQHETVTERKRRYQRTYGGQFHWEAREAFNDARKALGLNIVESMRYHGDFYDEVSRVVRGDKTGLIDNPAAPYIERAAAAMKKTYAEMATAARKSGLEGAEALEPNDAYVNRVWNHDAVREAIKVHGKDAVHRVIADAIQVPGLRGNVEKAQKFLSAVMKLEFDHRLQDIQLHAKDMITLRKELEGRLSKDEADAVIEIMFDVRHGDPDAGKPGNLRFRFDLDETHALNLDTGRLRLSDLFENDSRILVDKYLNTMAGHSALAERGITSQSQFRSRLEEARKWHGENQADTKAATAFNEEAQILEDMNSYIIGRPMSTQSFNAMDRVLGSLRAYTRSALLGQLGIAAAFEMKNALGLATFAAFWDQLPTFRGMIQALRSGKLPNAELSRDIEAMSGFGLERAASYARQNEVTDFTYDRGLTRFENFANKASHAVDIISGNNFVTSATRQFSAAAMVQKLYNMAGGKLKLNDKRIERLVHNGVDRERIPAVLEDLKAHTVASPRGTVLEVKWEDWQRSKPGTYSQFVTALNREVRDAIQDHDIGETGMWMHTTIGKVFSELRTFNLAAHSKQFLKGLHYHDRTTAITWTLAFAGEALGYAMQTTLNYAHNPEQLDKRLSADYIISAALQRMSVLGVSSYLLDTGHFVLTGEPLFTKGGTTNTDNRNLFLTPSMMTANRMLGSTTGLASALNPFSSDIVTKQNAKDMLSVLPAGNTWLMRNVNDYVSSQFPKRELNARHR